jgi:pSer/pThr/pTyr-binding forkhead associated (FHA) protein
MWLLTIRSPNTPPREHILKPGKTTIGRKAENDIPITDEAASRFHAEINFDQAGNALTLTDMGSTNGTLVNQERLTQPVKLHANDQIRIVQHTLDLDQRDTQPRSTAILLDTQPLSRSLLLESLDRFAVLLCDVSERLNTIIDLDTALREVSDLMREAMGADKSRVILAESFSHLQDMGFPTSIAQKAAVEALSGPQESVTAMRKEFDARRRFLVSALNAIPGLSCRAPTGAFYAFPRFTTSLGSKEVARRLLDEHSVAVLPGVIWRSAR